MATNAGGYVMDIVILDYYCQLYKAEDNDVVQRVAVAAAGVCARVRRVTRWVQPAC